MRFRYHVLYTGLLLAPIPVLFVLFQLPATGSSVSAEFFECIFAFFAGCFAIGIDWKNFVDPHERFMRRIREVARYNRKLTDYPSEKEEERPAPAREL